MKQFFWFAALYTLALAGCKPAEVKNPFDDIITDPVDTTGTQVIDSTSIIGIHKLILHDKCAIPSCHGGTFEPDFRTPASSWNTLVKQEVIKNNATYDFRYRVVPGDTTMSWLHERLVNDDPVLGRMPIYMPPLAAWEMRLINTWIMDGCKDVYGVQAQETNKNISFYGVGCFDNQQNYYDINRLSWGQPFTAPANTDLFFDMYAWDDHTPNPQFQNVKLQFSSDAYFFTNPVELDSLWFQPNKWLWRGKVSAGKLPAGQQIFYRFSGHDGTDMQATHFPNMLSQSYFFQHHSFILQ
jgi:hypothetical protein